MFTWAFKTEWTYAVSHKICTRFFVSLRCKKWVRTRLIENNGCADVANSSCPQGCIFGGFFAMREINNTKITLEWTHEHSSRQYILLLSATISPSNVANMVFNFFVLGVRFSCNILLSMSWKYHIFPSMCVQLICRHTGFVPCSLRLIYHQCHIRTSPYQIFSATLVKGDALTI